MVLMSLGLSVSAGERGVGVRNAAQGVQSFFSGKSYAVHEGAYILEDASHSLTIDQVASGDLDDQFWQNRQGLLNLGSSHSTFWIKFTLTYPDAYPNTKEEDRWYLELGRPLLNEAELFVPTETHGVYEVLFSELQAPFDNRFIKHVNSIFPLVLYMGDEMTFYLKVRNEGSFFKLPIMAWSPIEFIDKSAREEFVYGVFFGCMLVLIMFNCFLWFSIKDNSYIFYVVYLIGATGFMLLELGHGVIHLSWFDQSVWNNNVLTFTSLTALGGALFFREFFEIKKYNPRIDNVLMVMFKISLMSLVMVTLDASYAAVQWSIIYGLGNVVIISGFGLYCWSKGNESGGVFFIAWLSSAVGLMIFGFLVVGWVPINAYTINVLPVGLLMQASLFSFALAKRIKDIQARKIESNTATMSYMRKYQSLFDNALEGMYLTSLRGSVLNSNLSFTRMFGNSTAQSSKSLEDLLSVVKDKSSAYENLLEEGFYHEEKTIGKGGEIRFIEHKMRLIEGVVGEEPHIEGVVIDVTDEVKKGKAIKGGIKERISKEAAINAASEKSRFLTSMSHEIRTPLTAIIGFGELLKEDLDKKDKNEFLRRVSASSKDLLKVVNNILDYSKIDAGRLCIESVEVDMTVIIRKLRYEYRDFALRKGVTFNLTVMARFPKLIMGDPTRIYQVMGNIVDNALRYTDKGKVAIVVAWNQGNLSCEVKDTGRGIPTMNQRDLFETRGDKRTLMGKGGGAGLGLPIAERLLQLMGGRLRIEEADKKGTIVAFQIKVAKVESSGWIKEDVCLSVAMGDNRGSSVRQQLSGTVLLAEDNVVNQKLISKLLGRFGVDVVVANDGIEACEYCDETLPDVVLMDINMPNRGGVEATEYLRQKGVDIPIYALTAETGEGEISKVIEAGCQGVLSKPINKDTLFETLNGYLGDE
ncbi:hypothetical protein A9Q99_26805 [Gammaproteobacteria bacterium 45_16_T64]|nr:hypothetical protein A9Q99_26805 [Gammaproteobacteria bacterium 45_16_T64]